jgi:NodT family efflux transporter outer membrane factor (OMF) lipoprotein
MKMKSSAWEYRGFICSLSLGVLLVSGCSVGPNYRRPDDVLAASWLEAQRAEFDTQPATLVNWWTEFNDVELNSLVERAVNSNLDIAIAEARVRESRASQLLSEAGEWPTVDLSGSYSRNRSSENAVAARGQGAVGTPRSTSNLEQDLFRTGFDAGWEIDVFGGTRRSIEAARANVEASIEDRRDVLVTLLGDVAKNYIDLRGRQRQLAVTQANLEAQQESLRLTRIRFDAGLASDLEIAQAEGQAQTTAAQIPTLESGIKQTAYRLDLLLGAQPGATWNELSGSAPIPALPPQARVGLPAELLRRRPDIRRAERQLAAATAQIGAATADLYPRFFLIGTFGLQSISASDWFSAQSRFWTIGPTIRWPVFDAGKIRANIEIRNAQQDQALKFYEKSVLGALGDVESALVNYSKEQIRYRSLLAAVDANRRALQMSNDLYTQGLVAFLNVLDAQRAVYGSENDLAQSEANMASNLVALYKALGGGWDIQ